MKMNNSSILENLNPSQRKAVEIINGPLLVLAGAGTGKTKVITHRIANLIQNWIPPESILGLTFTNKAAKEMKERIGALLGHETGSKILLGTFHAFCLRILKKEVERTRLHKNFTIADEQDQKGVLKLAIAELKLTEDEVDVGYFMSLIGKSKQELKFPEDYKPSSYAYKGAIGSRIYDKYQELLIAQNMLDFDDILMYTVDLWEKNPDILEKYQEIYKYILIDEFQDTNYAQFKLIKLLSAKYKNLCVVGDDDQSIYGWRGAVVENILDFPVNFPGCQVIKLEQNYRSTNNILETANVFISGNKKRHSKKLWSENGDGNKIKLATLKTDKDEAVFVANSISRLQHENHGLKYKDIAVLYRSNHQSRLFEEQFRFHHIPYRLIGSSFYDRKEIRDAVAYLKIMVNPCDDQNLLRILGVPPRNLGLKFIESARQFNARMPLLSIFMSPEFQATLSPKQRPVLEAFCGVINEYKTLFDMPNNLALKTRNFFNDIGYLNCFQKIYRKIDEAEDRKENVVEFINAIAQFEESFSKTNGDVMLSDYLDSFSLSDDNDKSEGDENKNAVTLLTVHSSKGLEFPCVFIVGMEQDIFPHARALEERDTDEERRLFYVAVTRAKKFLYISNAETRYRYGRLSYQVSSEFIPELPEALIENVTMKKTRVDDKVLKESFEKFYAMFGQDKTE